MKMYLSAENTQYLETLVTPAGVQGESMEITVDETAGYQTLLGFGGAFTEAAAVTYAKMGEQNRRKILEAYFDTGKGLGYSLGRVAVASSDFSVDMYDYLDSEDISTFDISREEDAVFPMVREAVKTRGSALQLLASPWSPPAYMKDSKTRKHGGTLLPEFYEDYAKYLVRYIQEARGRDIPIAFLSVQNEPEATQVWDSCRYTAQQERDFVKNYLGPALEAANLKDIKLLIHDHNRGILLERALKIFEDVEALRYIWGSAIHWYMDEKFEEAAKLHKAYPDKHLLFTEGCVEGGPAPGKWGNGERYARNIIGDLNNWVEGWIEWNLVLDMQGGPNHVGNYCCAPILCDTENDKLIFNPSYHFIGHFARHIKPGAARIAHACRHGNKDNTYGSGSNKENSTGNENVNLNTLSARNPDGTLVLVILNEADNEQPVTVNFGKETAGTVLPPHSIATIIA